MFLFSRKKSKRRRLYCSMSSSSSNQTISSIQRPPALHKFQVSTLACILFNFFFAFRKILRLRSQTERIQQVFTYGIIVCSTVSVVKIDTTPSLLRIVWNAASRTGHKGAHRVSPLDSFQAINILLASKL